MEILGYIGTFHSHAEEAFSILDILTDALLDSLKMLPFLFAAFLFMEYFEHKAGDKLANALQKMGGFGSVGGALMGCIPQCGFSVAASNLYAGELITAGTLLAVFLSTSDEMLPILLSSSAPAPLILKLLGYKALAGIVLGIAVDTAASKLGCERKKTIHEMCEQEHCRCEDGIFKSALRHTVKIFAFLFAVTFVLNLLVEAVGPETLGAFVLNRPVIGELLGGVIGLIPNCAASVVLTTLYLEGAMSGGAMLSGLLVGSGVGLLVLLRMNRDWRDNLVTAGLLYAGGVVFGLLADVLHVV